MTSPNDFRTPFRRQHRHNHSLHPLRPARVAVPRRAPSLVLLEERPFRAVVYEAVDLVVVLAGRWGANQELGAVLRVRVHAPPQTCDPAVGEEGQRRTPGLREVGRVVALGGGWDGRAARLKDHL